MNALLERARGMWDDLNDREKRMVAVLGVVATVCVLGFPLFWTARQNAEIEETNTELREALQLIGKHRGQLEQLAEARKLAAERYAHHTPPLGTFLEQQAKKQSLTITEVTDQPEKAEGSYRRRSVRASINNVDLTGIVELLDGIITSPYPVAIDQLQIEHYQPGDSYRFKLGVLTFDHKETKAKPAGAKAERMGPNPSDG